MRCIDCTEPATHRGRCKMHHAATRFGRVSVPDERGDDDGRTAGMLRHGSAGECRNGARPGATGAWAPSPRMGWTWTTYARCRSVARTLTATCRCCARVPRVEDAYRVRGRTLAGCPPPLRRPKGPARAVPTARSLLRPSGLVKRSSIKARLALPTSSQGLQVSAPAILGQGEPSGHARSGDTRHGAISRP